MSLREKIVRDVGRYRIVEEIGRGGMAVVYRAIDTSLKREVALKVLHPHLASHGESRARFHREAQAVARLKHDCVLEIYDYSGEETEDAYIVMELISGTTLRKLIDKDKGEPIFAEAALLLIRPVLEALSHAHSNGLIHRDVKPENILIGPGGDIKLSDFGIAHIAGMTEMTVTGQILGSPAYMSPEHVELVELDARADIFSLGIVLYELAVGRQPFAGNSPHAVLKRIMDGQFDDPINVVPSVGLPVANIIRKCLQPNPNDRYNTVSALIEDVDQALSCLEIKSPKQLLKNYLLDSDTWIQTHKSAILEKTLELGIFAKKSGCHNEAAAHFNRILALDPGNEKALTQVSGMNRSIAVRRILEKSIVALTFLVVVSTIIWSFLCSDRQPTSTSPISEMLPSVEIDTSSELSDTQEEQPSAQEGKIPSNDTTEDANTDSNENNDTDNIIKTHNTLQLDSEKQDSAAEHKKVPKTRHVPPKSDPILYREVVFTPHPLSVEITIDNEKPFPFGPANRTKKLSVGKHKITFTPIDKQRLLEQTWAVDIPEGDTPFPFRGRLMWRPAKLHIKCNISASVTIPGRTTDVTNNVFNVDVKKGPTENLSVLISQEGYVPQTKQVTITAGELSVIEIKLTKSAAVQ